jgi:hypothetical protein
MPADGINLPPKRDLGEEGETRTVMVPRVTIVPTEDLDKATLDAIADRKHGYTARLQNSAACPLRSSPDRLPDFS